MIRQVVIDPIQKFINIESFSGILLFIASIAALLWANSDWAGLYTEILQYDIGITTETFEFKKPLILWINDGLMAVFFFLIGLEIKRELLIGELNTVKKAAFPFFAAIGGIVFPVSLYLIFNQNADANSGWAVPMATDIAFTLAILKLLGKRVPLSLKIFLTAFAIVDDLGAVIIIALFYSSGIEYSLLLYASALLGFLSYLSYKHIYSKYLYFIIAAITWFLFLKAGIHPTIAGVLVAFTIPIRKKVDTGVFVKKLKMIVTNIENTSSKDREILSDEQIQHIDNLESWTESVQSPLQHLEHKLHNWVSYLIMPIFALANAGVNFTDSTDINMELAGVIALSLIFGNTIGIGLLTFIGLKMKVIKLPDGIRFKHIMGVAVLAGVGFTMSIFVANLAFFGNEALLDSAKIGILLGSLIAGVLGYVILLITLKPVRH